ncbi:hypothetical protein CK203_057294 [Vitis vinifera]|uniref:Uncharacterized protein n=1 Tax=Vitis vinifera TaxID=29760 RepID=A0A438GKN4_VITVI|nr:hypothetical protein CK203_057294 [Vitis vinifera]
MRVSDGIINWDDFDGAPVASLPTQCRMLEIEREKIAQIVDCPSEKDQIGSVWYKEGITRGLWPKSSPFDSKGNKPSRRQRLEDVNTISSARSRSLKWYQTFEADTTVLPARYAFESSFPEARGGCVTTNPLPAHSTHAVPPPSGGIHHIDFVENDNLHMMSWDDGLLEPIVLDDGYEILTRSGRVAQPLPLVAMPFDSAFFHEEIRVETNTTPKGLIHMMMVDRATCIVFLDDDLPPKGSDHTHPLYITIGCSVHRVPSVLLDNGSALNVYPLAIAIALGYAPSDFGPFT